MHVGRFGTDHAIPPEVSRFYPVAALLAMDRTTLTANLKPLERRVLVKIMVDPKDRRSRLLGLTDAGRALLKSAVPIWTRTHREIERLLADGSGDDLRAGLRALS